MKGRFFFVIWSDLMGCNVWGMRGEWRRDMGAGHGKREGNGNVGVGYV
jgi:hypothetical protein